MTEKEIITKVNKLSIPKIRKLADTTLKIAKEHNFSGIKELHWWGMAQEALIVIRLCKEITKLRKELKNATEKKS